MRSTVATAPTTRFIAGHLLTSSTPLQATMSESPIPGTLGVAIGHRLISHSHEADHGKQRHEVPEPADEEPRSRPTCAPGDRRHARNEEAGDSDAPDGNWQLQRIEDGQAARPDRLLAVPGAGDDRVG